MLTKLLTAINPFAYYIKLGLALAVCFLIGYLFVENGRWQGKYLTAQGTISEQRGKINEWTSSNKILLQAIGEQNQSISDLEAAKKMAESNALAANKKAQTILAVRQAQNKKAVESSNTIRTCEEAIAKAKSDLKGSLL